MNDLDKYAGYAFEKLCNTMSALMATEDMDDRNALRKIAADYAAILTALKD